MKVKFNTSLAGVDFSFKKNEVAELPDKQAASFLNAGLCEAVKEERQKLTIKKEKAVL